ncbi:tRNA lysidine(34) synthetase TilS [Candidatus Phytoplasma pini]|nr:tRNA lysidine(34) synthetase TilS [Candidatus Phytoplasma pini]
MINLSVKLDKKKIYIIAVSGGVDSMVLLNFLFRRNYFLIVVHFNHLKRLEAINEKKIVQKYCQLMKISFHYFELNVGNKDFQNQARKLRYQKLKEIAIQYKTNYLITAHHLDDLSETILFKMARGSSLLGYSGLSSSFYHDGFFFLKPFLYVSKKKIIDYAIKNKIIFLEDYTNQLDIYTRNKIRNQIIPYFKKINNNFLQNIKHFHLQMMDVFDFIRKQTHIFLKTYNKNSFFDLKLFLTLDSTVQKDIILYLLEMKQIKKNFTLINNIWKSLKNIQKPYVEWFLDKIWIFQKNYNYFTIKKKLISEKKLNFKPKPLLYYCFDKKLISFCSIIQEIKCDFNKIIPPFILRKRKFGDILKFTFGTQKLKKFLIDKKIPLKKRDDILLVVDQKKNIIWIPGIYINNALCQKDVFYLGIK